MIKMKKYFYIAIAALGFAACAEKIDDNAPHNGEVEESYIAINLMSADVNTRAAEDEYGYEDGTEAERKIKSAYFFFFDENGNPFNVLGAPATAPGGDQNYLQLSITTTDNGSAENVSDISNAVLVLNTYKGIYPKQIVAVLNWVPVNKSYSLTDLHEVLNGTLGNDLDGYVMSNSVYMNGDKIIDANPISVNDIKTTPEDAKNSPINIYVERTAAKVILTAGGKLSETQNIFKVTEDNAFVPVGGNGITVYMQLQGWELFNDYQTSTLLKNIENWDVATLGLTWNDSPYYRCYWANTQTASLSDSFSWSYSYENQLAKGFQTEYGFNIASSSNYNDRTAYTYCGENTNQATSTEDPRTKVILKGQLMQKDGDTFKPLEVASWYGNKYAGSDNLKTAVANSLKYVLYSSTDGGQSFTSIKPEDIECVGEVNGTESYEIGFQLSSSAHAKAWYKRSSERGEEFLGDMSEPGDNVLKTNEYLAAQVEPALLYANGMTYYIVDIEHLGTAGAKYGVVRNHVYQIDINSIKGYGSPVYNGQSFIVDQPVYPPTDGESSYVAARINVLSWKVVKQGVNIVQ